MLSHIAVGAKHLKTFRPAVVSEESVQVPAAPADLSSMLGPSALHVINGKEAPIGLPTTYALATIGISDLSSEVLRSFGSFLETDCTVFFGSQLLLPAISAQTGRRQLVPMSLCSALRRLSALFA